MSFRNTLIEFFNELGNQLSDNPKRAPAVAPGKSGAICEFFYQLSDQLYRDLGDQPYRNPTSPVRFVPPDNRHTESVPVFRAHLRSLGLSESEASDVLLARTIGGMLYLHSKGYTWEQIDEMPAAYLAKPTNPVEYGQYCRLLRDHYAEMKLRQACGL